MNHLASTYLSFSFHKMNIKNGIYLLVVVFGLDEWIHEKYSESSLIIGRLCDFKQNDM